MKTHLEMRPKAPRFTLQFIEGHWKLKGDQVVLFFHPLYRKRIVLRDGSKVRNPDSQRVRADLLKQGLKAAVKGRHMVLSHSAIDDAYCWALRNDGASRLKTALCRLRLHFSGLLTKGPLYYA